MPDPIDSTLTALADAAFRQAAAKVIRRARQSGTPLILWDQDGVRSVPPDVFDLREEKSATDGTPTEHGGTS